MQNEIYDEKNGLTYMLCGDYYLPELALTDIEPTYGKYGMLRKSYLQEHRKAKYQILLLQGKLVEHLNQIDAEARDREEQYSSLSFRVYHFRQNYLFCIMTKGIHPPCPFHVVLPF